MNKEKSLTVDGEITEIEHKTWGCLDLKDRNTSNDKKNKLPFTKFPVEGLINIEKLSEWKR